MASLRVLDSISELEQVVDLEIAIWKLNPRDAAPASLMHASVLNGGVVIGAYEGGRIVGLAYAIPSRRGRKWMLWSHMTGVHPDYQGQGIGLSLKRAQRQWALEHGYSRISWTFDPLQRGNANFNLRLLGTTANIYHVDFYGVMTDGINAGLPSDRLEVQWDLRSRRVTSLAAGESPAPLVDSYPDDCFLLRVGENGRPLLLGELDSAARWSFVEIPFDLALLKQVDRDAAYEWRIALRRVLQDAFSRGYVVVDFVVVGERCWYVLRASSVWYLYVLECSDQTLYTGVTTDLQRRLEEHSAGRGAAYTASRCPVRLVAAWRFPGRGAALRAEASFKRQSRQTKLDYVRRRLPYRGADFVRTI